MSGILIPPALRALLTQGLDRFRERLPDDLPALEQARRDHDRIVEHYEKARDIAHRAVSLRRQFEERKDQRILSLFDEAYDDLCRVKSQVVPASAYISTSLDDLDDEAVKILDEWLHAHFESTKGEHAIALQIEVLHYERRLIIEAITKAASQDSGKARLPKHGGRRGRPPKKAGRKLKYDRVFVDAVMSLYWKRQGKPRIHYDIADDLRDRFPSITPKVVEKVVRSVKECQRRLAGR